MIYLVTAVQSLFDNEEYQIITKDKALEILNPMKMIQFDTETLGKNCHVGKLLLAQFGSIDKSIQILIDCTTIDIRFFKYKLCLRFIAGESFKKIM